MGSTPARGGTQGFDKSLLVNPDLPDQFFCPIWYGVVNQPVSCDKWKRPFWKFWIQQWQHACPMCKRTTTYVPETGTFAEMIRSLDIYCPNKEQGWTKIFTLSKLKAHAKICEYEIIMCPHRNWGYKCFRKEMGDHRSNCRFQYVNWEFECGERFMLKDSANHEWLGKLRSKIEALNIVITEKDAIILQQKEEIDKLTNKAK